MNKRHHHFYLHCLVKARNRYTMCSYENNLNPKLPQKKNDKVMVMVMRDKLNIDTELRPLWYFSFCSTVQYSTVQFLQYTHLNLKCFWWKNISQVANFLFFTGNFPAKINSVEQKVNFLA